MCHKLMLMDLLLDVYASSPELQPEAAPFSTRTRIVTQEPTVRLLVENLEERGEAPR